MVADAQSIDCETMAIEITRPDAPLQITNMKQDAYNFVETQAGTNTVICGAELESPHFHASEAGEHTVLKIDIKVNYVQGTQTDVRRRSLAIPMGSQEEALASEERPADTDSLMIEFDIIDPELELGALESMMAEKLFYGKRFALLMLVVGAAYVGYNHSNSNKIAS